MSDDPASQSLSNNGSESFGNWFKGFLKQPFGKTVAVLTILSLVWRAWELIQETPPALRGLAQLVPSILNALVILFLLTLLPKVTFKPSLLLRVQSVEGCIDRFLTWWALLWLVWLVFYLATASAGILAIAWQGRSVDGNLKMGWEVAQDTLNNAQTLFFFVCAWLIPRDKKTPIHARTPRLRLVRLVSFIITLTCLELLFGLADGERFVTEWPGKAFGFFSGGIALLGIWLFTRHLADKLLKVPNYLIWAFYIYAIIQISYGLFRLEGFAWSQYIVFSVALLLKVALFAAVSWLVMSGSLERYFKAFPTATLAIS
jgi:hypothetical protein